MSVRIGRACGAAAAALLAGAVLGSPGALMWQAEIDGSTTDVYDATQPNDAAYSVAIDGAGNVFGGGRLNNVGTGFDFAVAKRSGSNGTAIWLTSVNGTDGTFEWARSVAVDGAGDVFGAGRLQNTGTQYDFSIVKLSGATGSELWRQSVNGTLGMFDYAWSVAVDSSGDAVAAGRLNNTGTGYDLAVVKVSGATGAVMWKTSVNGTVGSFEWAEPVIVDAAGDVIAAGRLNNLGTGYDFAVVKLSGATGAVAWQKSISGTVGTFDEARAVAVDPSGNVVAAGRLNNTGTSYDFMVVKLSSAAGAEMWRREINGTANLTDEARSVRTDASGDVIAAGRLNNLNTAYDFSVIKLSGATGATLWKDDINGTEGLFDEATVVAVTSLGNVIAGGELDASGTGGHDMAVIGLNGATGAELWRKELNGTATGSVDETFLAVDSAGDAVAGGTLVNAATADDFDVVKIDGGPPCLADFNGDGIVGILDFLGVLAAWGTANPLYDIAPPGGDGIVGILDFLAVLAAWGPCP